MLRDYFCSKPITSLSLETDVFPFLVQKNLLYASSQPILPFDIGTVERYNSLASKYPLGFTNPIAFWDRDSTLNYDSGYTFRPEDFRFYEQKLELLKNLSNSGYSHVIITNQSGIGRNYYSELEFHKFNEQIFNYLAEREIYISDVFWCPHVPSPDGNPTCLCRKPGLELFTKAIHKYNGSHSDSVSIGDKLSDIEPASKLGIAGILLPSSSNFQI